MIFPLIAEESDCLPGEAEGVQQYRGCAWYHPSRCLSRELCLTQAGHEEVGGIYRI